MEHVPCSSTFEMSMHQFRIGKNCPWFSCVDHRLSSTGFFRPVHRPRNAQNKAQLWISERHNEASHLPTTPTEIRSSIYGIDFAHSSRFLAFHQEWPTLSDCCTDLMSILKNRSTPSKQWKKSPLPKPHNYTFPEGKFVQCKLDVKTLLHTRIYDEYGPPKVRPGVLKARQPKSGGRSPEKKEHKDKLRHGTSSDKLSSPSKYAGRGLVIRPIRSQHHRTLGPSDEEFDFDLSESEKKIVPTRLKRHLTANPDLDL